MNEEGFFFDSTDGYFKKDKEESTSIDIKPSVETVNPPFLKHQNVRMLIYNRFYK